MMIDHDVFMRALRQSHFEPGLSQAQGEGLTLLVTRWESNSLPQDERHLAYILATAFHETGATMQPIRERGGGAYLTRLYDVEGRNPARARTNGNSEPGDGIRYAGRGFVQLTWKNNYRRVGGLISIDLLANPDRALEPGIAAGILVRGMGEGWFTGRRLSEFFAPTQSDWINARRIINGLDRAAQIAAYGQQFLQAIREAQTPAKRATLKPAKPADPAVPRGSQPSLRRRSR